MSESFNPLSAALDVFNIVSDWCTEQPGDDEHAQEMWEAARELAEWVGNHQAERARLEGELVALRALIGGSTRPTLRGEAKPSTLRKRRQREREKLARDGVTSGVTVTRDSVTESVTAPSLSDSPSDLSLSISSDSLAFSEKEREIARAGASVTVTRDSVTERDISFDARLWEQWAQANRRESMGAINHDAIRSMRSALSATESTALAEFRRAADAYLADCKKRDRRGYFAFLAKDIGTWLQPTGTPARGPVPPASRLLNPPPTKAGAA